MAGTGGIGSLLEKLNGVLSLGGGEPAVGLSIGSSSIKIVVLKKAGKGWKLQHFGMYQLPDETISNREIVNHVAVVEGIRTLVGQLKLKAKNVCTSISGTSLIIKRMQLEVKNAKEIQEQIFWEAEQYLPFDVSDVYMDYHVLSRGKDNQTDALLVAIKKSVLDGYLAAIEDAGLKAKVFDVDFFAMQNQFEANNPQSASEAVAIADIGASALKLSVVHAGAPVFTKDSAMGGRNLTSEIQRQLNLSFADAEALKTGGAGNGMPQEIADLMNVMAENLATEIKRGIDYYNNSSGGAPVGSIQLMGGGSKIPGLIRVVEGSCGLPCQMANPFGAVAYDPSVFTQDYIGMIAPFAAIPVGLAIRAGAPGGK